MAAEKVEKAVKALLNYLYHKRLRIERKHKKSQFSGIGIEVTYSNQHGEVLSISCDADIPLFPMLDNS